MVSAAVHPRCRIERLLAIISLIFLISCGDIQGCRSAPEHALDSDHGRRLRWPAREDSGLVADPQLNLEPLFPTDRPDQLAGFEDLRISDLLDRARLSEIRSHLRRRAEEWASLPLHRTDNLVIERWCGPAVELRACDSAVIKRSHEPGAQWIEVGVFQDPQDLDDLYGLSLSALDRPRRSPWMLEIHYEISSREGLDQGLEVTFSEFDNGEIVQHISLGTSWSITRGSFEQQIRSPGLPTDRPAAARRAVEQELALLLDSPLSLRDTAWERLDQLRNECERRIARCGEPADIESETTCEGIPRDDESRRQLLDQIRSDLRLRRTLVEAQAMLMHQRLSALIARPGAPNR